MASTSSLPQRMSARGQFVQETSLVLGSIFLLTIIILFFHLSTRGPDSLLFYLILVLVFACIRGLRAALLTSFVAFLLFDFLFVPPMYSLVVAKFEDIITLAFFLIAAVTTSQIASSLRTRTLQAHRRAYESRTLYEFMRATNRETNFEQQLLIFVTAIADVFASAGVRDCMLLLPDASNTLQIRSSAPSCVESMPLLVDEEITAAWVLHSARLADLYHCVFPSSRPADAEGKKSTSWRGKKPEHAVIRLMPLKTETKVYGVLRLLIAETRHSGRTRNESGREYSPLSVQDPFFSTFLEQAITIIEQEHLREAGIRLEVLQQTEALRSALFSSVSHDLRTPLATIKAAVGNLLQEETQEGLVGHQRSAHTIEREVDRLDGLVENLLDMSRIEAGSLRLEKVWYPLGELVSDTINRLQAHLGDREIRISYPNNLPPAELDVVQIEQVVFNILENAVRYTPDGSPLEISIQRLANFLQVNIADRGPGIPFSEQEQIFTKFYRLAHHGHPRGLGLGLAICQGIIQAHDGQIWVEPREEGGAIFCFTLPFHEIEEGSGDD